MKNHVLTFSSLRSLCFQRRSELNQKPGSFDTDRVARSTEVAVDRARPVHHEMSLVNTITCVDNVSDEENA
ncbi:uncharacterized protein PHALS_08896 [Plasmopara halstedii]|uniref:Uncharacterized protein n=1 Tax=Plasmopara halstedii TaxID=4781 RepID=A0A0P1AD72_PLAHL|nr:uncharacterized protein PHALS_08896 [Plasmopara halstedii]CEG38846.1 hypothetical protein PHALS_08896 [Plasmopara halstedii]|eukprot:XP_024575215.1 hypothetical protein PHALS_08896 [Plasmopara halstedii]